MKTQPDLGIKDPYALDQTQLDAAVSLLKDQRQNVSEYWSDYLKEVQAFETGNSVIGTTWQVIEQAGRRREGRRSKAILPDRGRDRLVGHLDDQLEGQAPELRLRVDVLHHRARSRSRRSRSTSVRRRPTARPARSPGKAFCKAYHVDGQGLRRQDLVLDHADLAVPRRSHRHAVHRLRRLDPGLDRDQGLITLAFCRTASSPGLRTGLLLLPPMLWLGVAYLAGPGGAASSPRCGARTTSPATIERIWTLDNYRDALGRSRSTGRSRSARSASRRW